MDLVKIRHLPPGSPASSRRRWHRVGQMMAILLLLSLSACSKREATSTRPRPDTVTKKRPGGNARDPHFAALDRQASQQWGFRMDKDRQARFPLPDPQNWTRVRFGVLPHFTGFRYGKKHHAVTAAFVIPLRKDDPRTSAACVQRFEERARPQVSDLGGEVSDQRIRIETWEGMPLVVRTATGKIDVLFKHYEVAAAWTGYPAYPGECMVYAVVVPWRKHRKLAERVRDNWIENGFKRFEPLTPEAPYRR